MSQVNTVSADTQLLAGQLRQAYRTRTPLAPLRQSLSHLDIDVAYSIQQANTALWESQGRRVVGRKIGLTSASVQKQLGVDQPDYGMLFADMAVADGEEVDINRLLQPKVEAEIALVLDRDLDKDLCTMVDLIGAVAYALPAIEIVDSRIANWDIGIVDTVADNASAGLFVLGNRPVALKDFDARLCGMVMERNGEQISLGAGAACLGHPLNAALWLVRKMADSGRPLLAGDIILTGALGPMVAVSVGDAVQARIEGLGSVRVAFNKIEGQA